MVVHVIRYPQGLLTGDVADHVIVFGGILLESEPVRPLLVLLVQHQLDHAPEILRVALPQPIDIIPQRLPVNPRVTVPVAVILVLQQPGLQHDHPHRPDVTLVTIVLPRVLCVQAAYLLGGEVQFRGGVGCQHAVQVCLDACYEGVHHLDCAGARQQDIVASEG